MTDFLLGPLWTDLALLLMRVLLGGFMVLYRFRFFYDPSQPDPWFSKYRRDLLGDRLCSCSYPTAYAIRLAIAGVEVLAGIALIVGLLTVPAAFGLLVILVFATCCTYKENTEVQKPVDCVDWVSCYLRTIEPLYITFAVCIILLGPGAYSLDAWVLR